MDFVENITQHTVVICVNKREKAIAMQNTLGNSYNVVVSMNMYEGLKVISQEMPHIVICDSLLADGNAGTLYDRLKEHATLSKTPIVVAISRKTKEELQPLAGRNFSGFILGAVEPNTLRAKVRDAIQSHSPISPFFIEANQVGLDRKVKVSIAASAVGLSGDNLIVKSPMAVDGRASMFCVPENPAMGPAVVRMASNVSHGEEIYNIFPVNRIVGKGREWIGNLPQIDMDRGHEPTKHTVLFFEPSAARFQEFAQILEGYDIELVHGKTLEIALAMFTKGPQEYGALYISDLGTDGSGTEWQKLLDRLPKGDHSPVVCGVSSHQAKATDKIRYIKRPFGLGLLVEVLEAAFERGAKISDGAKSGAASSIPMSLQAHGQLLGIDEAGGILQVPFPIQVGSKLILDHEFLKRVWNDNALVKVEGCGVVATKPDLFQVRVTTLEVGMSKVKTWERVNAELDSLQQSQTTLASGEKKIA